MPDDWTRGLCATQTDDLHLLVKIAQRHRAALAVIGAAALRIRMSKFDRFTADVDVAVGLDWGDFDAFMATLRQNAWVQARNPMHRWKSMRGNLFDLVPAGPRLRAQGELTWPETGSVMSLVGFDHLFQDAEFTTAGICIPSLPALALTKMIAFLDRPHERGQDLDDLRELLVHYADTSDRLYDDEVHAAALPDFGLRPAFLLGCDLRRICAPMEMQAVRAFLEKIDSPGHARARFVNGNQIYDEDRERDSDLRIRAFRAGLGFD